MIHQALYRKYRPKNFDEVVGQEHITTILKNEVKGQKLAHSYLFTGSRGTGKTSCAKILAKAVNCLDQKEGNPCGVCEICEGLEDGSILDVTEMDAASNSSVEDIRQLREEAFFTPAVTRYRVYIIDEVHMLSANAFNALLKIMEEPPSHIIFILATTELHKVLPTIISRCERFDFRRIDPLIIARQLTEICSNEGLTIDNDAAGIIANLAEGGMRDALSLLDVCASYAAHITAETVMTAAGITGADELFAFADLMLAKDTKVLLDKLDATLSTSVEPSRLCEQLIAHYRNLMITKTVNDPAKLISYLPSYLPRLKEQAAALSLSDILYTLSLLQETSVRLGKTAVKKVELEVALVRLSQPQTKFDPDSILSRLEELEIALKNGNVKPRKQPVEQPAALEQNQAALTAPSSQPSAPPSHSEEQQAQSSFYPDAALAEQAPTSLRQEPMPPVEFEQWQQVLTRLAKLNPAVAGMLSGSKAFDDGRRVLIDIQNPALLQMLKVNDYTKNHIKQAILDVTGRNYGIGPYKSPSEERQVDRLEELIRSLPPSDFISIV